MAEIKCLSPNFREQLLHIAKEAGIKGAKLQVLEEIPDCEKGAIDVRPPKKKRAPSAYNIFIGQCMGGGSGKSLKECAVTYKQQKK